MAASTLSTEDDAEVDVIAVVCVVVLLVVRVDVMDTVVELLTDVLIAML